MLKNNACTWSWPWSLILLEMGSAWLTLKRIMVMWNSTLWTDYVHCTYIQNNVKFCIEFLLKLSNAYNDTKLGMHILHFTLKIRNEFLNLEKISEDIFACYMHRCLLVKHINRKSMCVWMRFCMWWLVVVVAVAVVEVHISTSTSVISYTMWSLWWNQSEVYCLQWIVHLTVHYVSIGLKSNNKESNVLD